LDLETKHIDLIYEYLAEDDFNIRIDRDKLKRVIHNIIGNASKYINAERGIVYVRVEETKEELIVRIMDNGVGIRKEELPMIFDRFYRTDSSRNSQTGGSGLGLSIAKKIVEDHAGKIWAESELGKGTEIFFSLPKQDEMEEIL
jgi:signal transduction histidine kinase